MAFVLGFTTGQVVDVYHVDGWHSGKLVGADPYFPDEYAIVVLSPTDKLDPGLAVTVALDTESIQPHAIDPR